MIMRKIYSILTAMLALFAINAHADKILYSENYESGTTVPSTWTVNGGTASIAGDTEGHYLSFALGQNNGRSAHCLWGESIFDSVKDNLTEYTVHYEFQMQAFGNNQYNGEMALFTGESCVKTNGNARGDWSPYCKVSSNCLWDINQAETEIKAMDTKDPSLWYLMGDETATLNLTVGSWYGVDATVNIATREVTWNLYDFDETMSKSGSFTLAEDANIYASGLYLMNARYYSVINIDNIMVSIPGDFANAPVIALTGVNMSERTYTITFQEGETLYVTTTDGTETAVGYYDASEVPGQYMVTTSTSGTLSAYTRVGDLQSDIVTVDVECTPIELPVPTYAIIAAEAGYAKTYKFTVDNKSVELKPEIFMDFTFMSEDGASDFTLENQNSGAEVAVPAKGTLTVTTKALGYAEGGTSVVNDIEYTVKHDIDFQHLTGDDLIAKGFVKIADLNSTKTSGEDSWTARKRMYYRIATGEVDEEGNPTYSTHVVYGPSGDIEGAVEGAEPIQRYHFYQSKLDKTTAYALFAPLYTWWREAGNSGLSQGDFEAAGTTNLKMYEGIGLVQSGVLGDDESYDPAGAGYGNIRLNNTTLGVDGLTDDDLIVVSKIDNYGGGSLHPDYEAGTDVDEARQQYKASHLGAVKETYKGTETFQLFRVDTALNRVLVLTPAKNIPTSVAISEREETTHHDGFVYNLNGQRINTPAKGLYIKNGKKIIK